MVAGEGFEPSTFGLWARRATRLLHPATKSKIEEHLIFGARDRVRTGDPQLGRLMLYQLSYSRLNNISILSLITNSVNTFLCEGWLLFLAKHILDLSSQVVYFWIRRGKLDLEQNVLKTSFFLIISVFDELGCLEHVLRAVELSLSRLQGVPRSYRGFGNGHREW